MMTEDNVREEECLELVVQFGKVVKPEELGVLPLPFLLATLEHSQTPYQITYLYHFGDGMSGMYDCTGKRIEYEG